jgi:secreted trypsin-like serine protease
MSYAIFGCSSGASTGEDDLDSRREAILGGQPDTAHDAVVAVTQLSAVCSGSLIDARNGSAWILTAGHCVVELDEQGEIKEPLVVLEPNELRVAVGNDFSRALEAGSLLPAVEVRVAPGYDGFSGNSNDIALLRVLGDTASLMTLPLLTPASDDLSEGEQVTLVGFGVTEDPDNTLRQSAEQTVSWLDQHFIGIDQTNGVGVCHGDSGGPVLVTRNGTLTVAGVNSVGTGTRANPCSKASTSTRIARFSEWIMEALAEPAAPVTHDTATADTRNDGGCALARSTGSAWSWRFGLVGWLGLMLLRRRRGRQARLLRTGSPARSSRPHGARSYP